MPGKPPTFASDEAHLTKFLTGLVHDIRNGISPLMMSVQMLKRSLEDDRSRDLLGTAERQISHLLRLVEQISDLAQLRGNIEMRDVQLGMVLDSVVGSHSRLVASAGHTLNVELPETDFYLSGNFHLLARALGALVDNAVRFTPPGGTVGIRVTQQGDGVTIAVTDSGVGIPEALLPVVTEPMSVERRASEFGGGCLGIGLATAQAAAILHGGSLSVSSEGEGKGSTVRMHLPLRVPATGAAEPAKATGTLES
ncbi:sensor histidine kinase [Tahibacter amnicola]|uniref:histidine kinase n=1 Tax=Tahibacter amnicola TaxID=2976241 RepID=A0ABY6B9J3_9GAMM|nr:HAMP domain-containing sensor histidine kinase [Tahibacter amnicola]UXI66525.1 HAMP domain-containing histidine kinase [Tahibacter amnicola]